MLGGIIKGSMISISIKNGNQICVGQFGTTNNPVVLCAEVFCMHAKGGKQILYLPMIPRKYFLLLRRDLVCTKRALATEHLA